MSQLKQARHARYSKIVETQAQCESGLEWFNEKSRSSGSIGPAANNDHLLRIKKKRSKSALSLEDREQQLYREPTTFKKIIRKSSVLSCYLSLWKMHFKDHWKKASLCDGLIKDDARVTIDPGIITTLQDV